MNRNRIAMGIIDRNDTGKSLLPGIFLHPVHKNLRRLQRNAASDLTHDIFRHPVLIHTSTPEYPPDCGRAKHTAVRITVYSYYL